MFARIRQLTSGAVSAQDIADRLEADLLPIYQAADGYISYSIVGIFTNGVMTVRVFDDFETMEAATELARDVQQAIATDLEIDADDDDLHGDVLVADRA